MKQNRHSMLWLAVGGLLMLLSNGRWIIPWATWLYPICFLRFMHMSKTGRGLLLLLLTSALVNSIAWWKMIPVPRIIYFFIVTIMMNIGSLAFLADRLMASKFKGFIKTLIFPLTWCSLEYISSLSPKGTWFSLAYTQSGNLTFLQLASLTGIWGISFLIGWFSSVVNWIWSEQFEWVKIRKGSLTFLLIGLTIILFGFIRMHFLPDAKSVVRTASIVNSRQINAGLAGCKWDDAQAISSFSREVEDNLLSKTREAISAGAKIVLWQESAGFIPRQEEKQFIQQAQQIAAKGKIYLLMTLWSVPENYPQQLVDNKMVIIDTSGSIRLTYFKNFPAPPEPIKKGDGNLPVLETAFGRISPAICFDAEFQNFIRQAGKNQTDILFLPANDWKAIDPLHTNMAIMRAIENGFSLVRPAGQGLSVATDNRGQVLASMDFFSTNDQVMYADVPAQHSQTMYTRLGDFFAWICIVGFLSMLLFVIFDRRTILKRELKNEYLKSNFQSDYAHGQG